MRVTRCAEAGMKAASNEVDTLRLAQQAAHQVSRRLLARGWLRRGEHVGEVTTAFVVRVPDG